MWRQASQFSTHPAIRRLGVSFCLKDVNQSGRVDVLVVGPLPTSGSYVGGIAMLIKAQLARWDLPVSVAHFNTQLWARHFGTTGQVRLSNLLAFFINVIRLAWVLVCRRPFIVHIHSSIKLALLKDLMLALLVRSLGASKVVFQVHFADAETILLSRSPLLRRSQLWLLMKCCDRIVFLSRNVVSQLAAMLPLETAATLQAKASILPVFTEVPARLNGRTVSQRPVVVFFIGNVGQRKGVYDLIRAAKQIRERCAIPFQMVFVGAFDSPKEKRCLLSLVAELELTDLVTFLGSVSEETKARAFQDADVFALPSYGEGVPMSLIEAMSYALPVVVTNVGGIPETVNNGQEGIVLSPGDIPALSAALASLIEAPELRLQMGLKARSRAQEYHSRQAFFKALGELYRSLGCLPHLS